MIARNICALAFVLMTLGIAGGPASKHVPIRGTYADPRPFWEKGGRLDEYGINAVFVHSGSVNDGLIARAKAEGAQVYAEFPTLNGKGYVEAHPEAWPVNEKGERAPAASWFLGACPTEPGFKAHRLKQLAEMLDRYELAGVFMDYFHWHAQFEDPQPILPETCFSETCLAAFQAGTGIRVPDGTTAGKAQWILANHDREWRDWRCSVLLDWARECRRVMRARRPDAVLGVYHCPWNDTEFNGARRRVLGLDLEQLAPLVDVLSPMVYHAKMGRPPEWVGENVKWLSDRIPAQPGGLPKIWPIVQAHNDPHVITAEEFEKVLSLGTTGRATGVMMFTIRSVAEDERKMRVMQRLYRGWAEK